MIASIPISKTKAVIEALLAVLVWGASFVASKIVLQDISPVTTVWLRFVMGVLVLGSAVAARRQFALPGRKDLAYFALVGFIGITFHQWLQSTALTVSQASTSAWIVSTSPIFMALLGWVALKEKLNLLKWSGILLAGAGVLLVVSGGDFAALQMGSFGNTGDLLMLVSAVNWAVFSVISRRGLGRFPAALMMLYVMAFGLMFTSVQFFAVQGWREIPQLTGGGWAALVFLGIACSGLAYIFWYDALQTLPASQVGAFLYIEPLVTAVGAALMIGEPVTWASLLGGAIIIAGVWMVQTK